MYHKADFYLRADNNDDDMCPMDEDDFLIGSPVKPESLLLASDDTKVSSLFYSSTVLDVSIYD